MLATSAHPCNFMLQSFLAQFIACMHVSLPDVGAHYGSEDPMYDYQIGSKYPIVHIE
jgi:hypothetical protein